MTTTTILRPWTRRSPEVADYLRLRDAADRLNRRLELTIPPEAEETVFGTMGRLHPDPSGFLDEEYDRACTDLCIHDWPGPAGRSVVRAFAESDAARELDAGERGVLDAMLGARHALLRIEEPWPGAGARAYDAIRGVEVVLLDERLGDGSCERGDWLVARLMSPSKDWWMTTGAMTVLGPLADAEVPRKMVAALQGARARAVPEGVVSLTLAAFALRVADARVEADLAERYPDIWGDGPPEPPLPPRPPGRNGPCPCGSGRKYKRCCGR